MKKKILISGMNGVIAHELVYFLKKKYYVIGIDSSKYGVGKKICDEFYISPQGNSKLFIQFLNKISKKVEYIFLYVDEEIINISKSKLLNTHTKDKIVLSPLKTLNICLNKLNFYNYFLNTNILIPKNVSSGKAIAKPIYGRGSRNINIINKKFDHLYFNKSDKFIVQKYIKGREYTIDCVFNNNFKLLNFISRERIITNGVSIVGKISKTVFFKKYIFNLTNFLNFYGPINLQVIVESISNKIYLIEINPRLSGSIIFSIKSGFNPIDIFIKNKTNKLKINDFKIKNNLVYSRYYKSLVI